MRMKRTPREIGVHRTPTPYPARRSRHGSAAVTAPYGHYVSDSTNVGAGDCGGVADGGSKLDLAAPTRSRCGSGSSTPSDAHRTEPLEVVAGNDMAVPHAQTSLDAAPGPPIG